ncbi:E3 ubiquitin-protein ligase DZIP3-like [Stylophora pistillata]|uniref:E3 ubiquitin-protein ligase DZIP3-like n=1 Tax=Stylophora pistillata TaxID=50429 RepID=UPI000C052E39|nr:E3 ubiquitin-protein ligase DZIP3-like [Stylophora pistillata]
MMASAAAPSFPSTTETTNYARLCRLLVGVGSDVLRETFDKKRPPGDLGTVLSSSRVHKELQKLKEKNVRKLSQWNKLYPVKKSSVSSNNFDITFLMILLRSICSLFPPPTGWDAPPPATDTTLEADIVRIKWYRNTIYGHASQASVDDVTFNQYWQDIQGPLVRLGGAG